MFGELLIFIVRGPRTESGCQSARLAIPVPQVTKVNQVISVVLLVFSAQAERWSWQRGTNENTYGLLRQYLRKNADLRSFSQDDLDTISARLNDRPCRVLDWDSPRRQ